MSTSQRQRELNASKISRRTTLVIAEAYQNRFRSVSKENTKPSEVDPINRTALHEFLYKNDFMPDFLNAMKNIRECGELKAFIMSLHTGEFRFSRELQEDARRELGQNYLERLAEDLLMDFDEREARLQKKWWKWPQRVSGFQDAERLKRSLEQDGKPYKRGIVQRKK